MTYNKIYIHSIQLVTKGMQFKITIVYFYLPDKMAKLRMTDNINYWEECEATRTWIKCWGKCKKKKKVWKTGERVWHFHIKLSTNFSNDLVMLLLGICSEKNENTCVYKNQIPLFIVAVFIIT